MDFRRRRFHKRTRANKEDLFDPNELSGRGDGDGGVVLAALHPLQVVDHVAEERSDQL